MAFEIEPDAKTASNLRRAIIAPHPAHERFDPEFPVAFTCNRCGKTGFGPRKYIREAMQVHWQEDCAARRSHADAPQEMRLTYPIVKE